MYTKEDFRKCFFNPLDKDLLANPRLQQLLPEKNDLPPEYTEMVIRYVLALYDPKSPLVRDYPDLNTRKIAAAGVVGFDTKKDEQCMERLFSCDSEYLIYVIVNYLRSVVKSRVWAALQADEQTFWEFVMRLMLPITRGDKDRDLVGAVSVKTKLSEDKESISNRLDHNWNKFLGDDEVLIKKVQSKDFSPEGVAGV